MSNLSTGIRSVEFKRLSEQISWNAASKYGELDSLRQHLGHSCQLVSVFFQKVGERLSDVPLEKPSPEEASVVPPEKPSLEEASDVPLEKPSLEFLQYSRKIKTASRGKAFLCCSGRSKCE